MAVSYNIIVLILLVLVLVNIRSLLGITDTLFRCLTFWRENVYVEDNISIMRVRNYYAVLASALLSIVALRYSMLIPSIVRALDPLLQPFAAIAVLALFFALRFVVFHLLFGLQDKRSVLNVVHRAIFNYVIIAAVLVLGTTWFLDLLGASESAIRGFMIVDIAALYLVMMVREAQILDSRYSGFMTFLYLCTLEILPVGIMVAAAMLL